jgi:outer membrane protein insertion porin family
LSVYYKTSSPYEDQNYYQLVTSGGSVRFGVPFTESDTVYFGAGLEKTTIVPGTSLPTSYLAYATQFGYNSSAVPLTVGWSRDRRDSSLAPNSGRLQRANAEWSVAGDALYVRSSYQYQEYFPLNKQFTLAVNGEVGVGVAVGERVYPVFKNYYGGGLGSVRGFEQGSLGPRDVSGTVVGGTRKVNLNAELLTPFPGAGNDRTLRMYGFVDVGSVGGPDGGLASNATANDLRSSTGVGVSWISPVGPLRLAFSWPVKNYAGDKMQSVQFQIGSSF